MIKIYDDFLSYNDFEHTCVMVREQIPYRLGWKDRREQSGMYIHSRLELEDLQQTGILQTIASTPSIKENILPTLFDFAVINLDTLGSMHYSHTHKNTNVLLIYLNNNWPQEWGGETLFFDSDTGKEIEFACTPKPNRAIWFDGEIPHSIRAPVCNEWRFSISLFFRKET